MAPLYNKTIQYDIISISHYFYPRVGGLETMAYELCEQLANSGSKVISIYTGEENKTNNFANFDNIQLKTISLFNKTYPVIGIKYLFTIISILLKNRSATILIHDRHLTTSVLAAMISWILRRDYILISHTTLSNYFKNKFFEKIGDFLENTIFTLVVRNAKHIATVSETNKQYLKDHFGIEENNVSVIYNGFNSRSISRFKLKPKDKAIVFATKWIPVKDPLTTLQAFSELAEKYHDWKFYFIGEGSTVIPAEPEDFPVNVILENRFYSKDELYSLLSRSYAYVNSSLNEGLSVGVVEAASLGNRLVLSDAPSNIEVARILKQEGSIFERKNSNNLVEKLTSVIEDYDRNSDTPMQISTLAKKHFSDSANLKRYNILISELKMANLPEKQNIGIKNQKKNLFYFAKKLVT